MAGPPAIYTRSGFGQVSRQILWADYASPYNFAAVDSQFGQGIACRIKALPDRPAIIRSIDLLPAFSLSGSNQAWAVRCLVMRGELPGFGDIVKIQQSTNFAPTIPATLLPQEVLWEDYRGANALNAAYNHHWDFNGGCGPSVGANEVMTVFYCIMYNNPTVAYGAGNLTYLGMTILGSGDGSGAGDRATGDQEGNRVRSIPRGAMG